MQFLRAVSHAVTHTDALQLVESDSDDEDHDDDTQDPLTSSPQQDAAVTREVCLLVACGRPVFRGCYGCCSTLVQHLGPQFLGARYFLSVFLLYVQSVKYTLHGPCIITFTIYLSCSLLVGALVVTLTCYGAYKYVVLLFLLLCNQSYQ